MTSKDKSFVEFAQLVMNLHREGYTYPPVLKQNGPDSDIIVLEFHTVDAAAPWACYFGAEPQDPVPHPVLPVQIVHYTVQYRGWCLQISGRERTKEKV